VAAEIALPDPAELQARFPPYCQLACQTLLVHSSCCDPLGSHELIDNNTPSSSFQLPLGLQTCLRCALVPSFCYCPL